MGGDDVDFPCNTPALDQDALCFPLMIIEQMIMNRCIFHAKHKLPNLDHVKLFSIPVIFWTYILDHDQSLTLSLKEI